MSAVDPNNPLGDLVPDKGGATVTPPPAKTAPAAPLPAAPPPPAAQAAPAAAPDPNSIMLQHLGQGGIGSDRVAAPPRPHSWWDLVPGTKGYGQPAQPGPQSWWDWGTKTYSPSAADVATAYGDDWSYGLSPLALQGVKSGVKAAGSPYDPLPPGLEPDAVRARIQQAHENLGPAGPLVTLAGMATSPLTYYGVGPASRVVGGVAKALPEASELAAKYLPDAVAKYVPEQLFPRMAEGGTTSGITGATHEAGAGGSPEEIALAAAANIPVGAALSGAATSLPLGRWTPEGVINKTAQGVQNAQAPLSKITIPSKDLGFQVLGQKDPTVAAVQEYSNWLNKVRPRDDTTPDAPGAPSDASAANPILNEGGKNVTDWMRQRIEQTTGPGSPHGAVIQQAEAAAQAARAQAQSAQDLARWSYKQGLPDTNVQSESVFADRHRPRPIPDGHVPGGRLEAIGQVGPGEPGPVPMPKLFRNALAGAGAMAGEAGSTFGLGHFGGSGPGAVAGNSLADAIEQWRTPPGEGALLQQRIRQAYRPLTGQPAPGPGANQALSNALLRLYGGGFGGQ